jgi:protein arginine kinase activator
MQGMEGGVPGERVLPEETAVQCPVCGYQFTLFKQTGRLGCPKCYESFASLLEPVIEGIHGKVRQVEGPPGEGTVKRTKRADREGNPKIAELRARLEEAVAKEQFEEAARLRDAIKKLKGV